jgi:hypothetical protein
MNLNLKEGRKEFNSRMMCVEETRMYLRKTLDPGGKVGRAQALGLWQHPQGKLGKVMASYSII